LNPEGKGAAAGRIASGGRWEGVVVLRFPGKAMGQRQPLTCNEHTPAEPRVHREKRSDKRYLT
jgi:hypothetical protein